MSVAIFNTHAFVKRLTAAGMPEAQAEALADEQMRLIDERLATKEDIARLEIATKAALKADLAETKSEILKWMFGSMGFQTIVILGAVFGLVHLFVH